MSNSIGLKMRLKWAFWEMFCHSDVNYGSFWLVYGSLRLKPSLTFLRLRHLISYFEARFRAQLSLPVFPENSP